MMPTVACPLDIACNRLLQLQAQPAYAQARSVSGSKIGTWEAAVWARAWLLREPAWTEIEVDWGRDNGLPGKGHRSLLLIGRKFECSVWWRLEETAASQKLARLLDTQADGIHVLLRSGDDDWMDHVALPGWAQASLNLALLEQSTPEASGQGRTTGRL